MRKRVFRQRFLSVVLASALAALLGGFSASGAWDWRSQSGFQSPVIPVGSGQSPNIMEAQKPFSSPSENMDPDTGFSDVPVEHPCYEAVRWAVQAGCLEAGATQFCPDEPITRAEVVSLLWRAEGSPQEDASGNPFTDVPDELLEPVLWAYRSGVASGVGEAEFAPDRPCTRGELITFLWRDAGAWPMLCDGLGLEDVDADSYCGSAVAWSSEYGVISDIADGPFAPDAPCTRADAVTFLYRSAQRAPYPDFLDSTASGWRWLTDRGWASGNWLIRDGRYYHFNGDGILDKVSATAPSLVSIPGYYIHPLKASVFSSREERIEAMISTAYEYLGDPFVVYRSTAPHTDGVDCSGLVMQCLYAAGFDPYPATPEHHSYTEYDSRTLWNEVDMPHIDPAEMQRGDLVFYKRTQKAKLINHIAIYLGNGYVIEAWPDEVTDCYPVAGGPHTVIYGVARPIT